MEIGISLQQIPDHKRDRIDITLVLCTYNRSGSLVLALKSVAASILPEQIAWEILVVDNNSTDETPAAVKDFCGAFPGRCRYILEHRQGLSHARNTGIQNARGDIVAFMDDDVTVDERWLHNLTASLYNGEWSGVGGRVLLKWSSCPPRWLSREGKQALSPFAMFDLGLKAGELAESPVGANMAYRKVMFQKYGLFRTDLGRCAGSLMSNEDTEFGARLLAGGERFWYEPAAVVYHPVPENRLNKGYLLSWHFGDGRSAMRRFGPRPGTSWYILGIPLYLARRITFRTVRWIFAVEASRRFTNKCKAWALAGQIMECHLSRSRAAKPSGSSEIQLADGMQAVQSSCAPAETYSRPSSAGSECERHRLRSQ